MLGAVDPTTTPHWAALSRHARELDAVHLRELFARDPGRAERLTRAVGDLVVDLSKQKVTDEVLAALVGLAGDTGVADRLAALFAGERINVTENRPVLHVALRAPAGTRILVDGHDVVADVHATLERCFDFARRVRAGEWTGATGRPVRTVVNIGIGGSDLGPVMAYEALAAYRHPRLRCRFVSNVDGTDLVRALEGLDPAETLFIVSSKTFTTVETMTNARSARAWLVGALGPDAVASHMVAVSTNREAVEAFGIDPDNMFGFWEWVGGRYSMDSAIGLSTMIAVGPENFRRLLEGFRTVDEHVRDTPPADNVAFLTGLVAVWNRSLLGLPTRVILPYSRALHRFPAYLQQLDMESNGKRVRLDGSPVTYPTGPVVWGEPGTNGQHSFHQLLHQGTTVVPADFIVFAEPDHGPDDLPDADEHHDLLVANALAQAEALAFGRTADEVAAAGVAPELVPHRTFPGDRPSTLIMAPRLTPGVLGQLVALYEHQVFVQGAVWGIDSFDQWGVELGKALATVIGPELAAGAPIGAHDSSTRAAVERYRRWRGRAAPDTAAT
ncbi:MAG: glucose-6-phosphate isomerase [Actinomyces sp.]|nr:MAG: glucose-6-phosphate isomerase [Actinomyces sp.]